MAYLYVDTDGSGATSPFDTWAKAAQTLQAAFDDAACVAGSTVYMQGALADTDSVSRTLTAPAATATNPVKVIGVLDGTTNTGASVVAADLAARGTSQPEFEVTGAGNDLTMGGSDNDISYFGIKFTVPDQMLPSPINTVKWVFTDCVFDVGGRIRLQTGPVEFINCEIIFGAGDYLQPQGSLLSMRGGVITYTGSPGAQNLLNTNPLTQSGGICEFIGVDMSDMPASSNLIVPGITTAGAARFVNCSLGATPNLTSTAFTSAQGSITVINSDDSTLVGNTSSIQYYEYEDAHGTISLETTAVRTGGADDGTGSVYSYAMTTLANAVLEGSQAALKSPWLRVWVAGGASKTLTVYIANDTASTDYNEDEVYCEFYTVNSGDTADHTQTFDPADERIVDSSTAITEDTGSIWGTGGNNHQKFSVTTTPGFEGFAYARVYLAKRQATPDTLYLDPKIEVT